MTAPSDQQQLQRPEWAVVDIGSNSVRLVMYAGPARAPMMVFNEKALCGLGERDLTTGALKPGPMHDALSVMRRYKLVIDSVRPRQVTVFATAGVRDATNGDVFLAALREMGFEPTLFSGDEEARLAALGILSGAPEIAHTPGGALAGDIGGGSLELCHVGHDHPDGIGPRVSLPLGGLRLSTQFQEDRKGARAHVAEVLASVPWLKTCPSTVLYAVGGAWRALGRVAIGQQRYPVEVLDYFELRQKDVQGLCGVIAKQSVSSLEEMPGVQRRRAPTLPFAAMVMEELFAATPLERLVFSASGVREGVLFDQLTAEDRAQDPLLVLAAHMSAQAPGLAPPDPDLLLGFLAPMFPGWDRARCRLWRTAAQLSNLAVHLHPEDRAARAARLGMSLPFHGLNHHGRALIAAALYHRHGGAQSALDRYVPTSLLGEEDRQDALRFGLALRFICKFDPTGSAALVQSRLSTDGTTLRLELPPAQEALWGVGLDKRFARFAAAFDLTVHEA